MSPRRVRYEIPSCYGQNTDVSLLRASTNPHKVLDAGPLPVAHPTAHWMLCRTSVEQIARPTEAVPTLF